MVEFYWFVFLGAFPFLEDFRLTPPALNEIGIRALGIFYCLKLKSLCLRGYGYLRLWRLSFNKSVMSILGSKENSSVQALAHEFPNWKNFAVVTQVVNHYT